MPFLVQVSSPRPRPIWCAVAILAGLLVAFLMVASVRPDLHEKCCHHGAGATAAEASADTCVVFGFANGVELLAGTISMTAPAIFFVVGLFGFAASAPVARPARLTPPACGPPALR